jgi:hypothetical protein
MNILENIEMLPKEVGHFVNKIFLINLLCYNRGASKGQGCSSKNPPLNYKVSLANRV